MTEYMGYVVVSADDALIAVSLSQSGGVPIDAWLEDERRADGIALESAISVEAAARLLDRWPRGRLFNPGFDLQWERHADGALHLVLIAGALPDGFQGVVKLQPVGEASAIIFWGTWSAARGWQEARIPEIDRLLPRAAQEPDRTEPHAALVVQQYEAPWMTADTVRVVTRYLHYTDTAAALPEGGHRA